MQTPLVSSAKMVARAYQGDAVTLLVFDLLHEQDRLDFVGFTIEFKEPTMPNFKALNNRIGFTAPPTDLTTAQKKKVKHPSTEAPFQKFRWLHVLRNFSKSGDEPFFGRYQYRITPRYFRDGALAAANSADGVTLSIDVQPFAKNGMNVAFTRGFLVSQAYSDRFGLNGNLRPANSDVVFDPTTTTNAIFSSTKPADIKKMEGITPYTYEEQYAWMGFNARKMLMAFIDEVMVDPSLSLDVLAYDFSEPTVAKNLLALSRQGRIRMFLDDHDLAKGVDNGGKRSDPEYKKRFTDQFDTSTGATLTRHHFSQLAHCKILIQRNQQGKAVKVLTGSTNFTVNGLYVNANHILILTQPDALSRYQELFDASIKPEAKKLFRQGPLAQGMFTISNDPRMSVSFAPHTQAVAKTILDTVNNRITQAASSVLFAVMELGSRGSVSATLRKLHERDDILTLGITDLQKETSEIQVRLFEPRSKKGVLINGKKSPHLLPPPLTGEVAIGLGHAVHHKFVVVDFNTPNAVVYCGSSNLAQGGEEGNGDNLLMIEDIDVATAFAIEALRLIDHYQFRNRLAAVTDNKPLLLRTDNEWYKKYFDPTDLYTFDKLTFLGR